MAQPIEKVNFKVLQGATKALNESGLLGDDTLKVVGNSKDVMIELLTNSIDALNEAGKIEEIPDPCIEWYNWYHGAEEAEAPAAPAAPAAGAASKSAPAAGEKPEKPAPKPKKKVEKSRYGHVKGSQAGMLDDLFHAGTTLKEAADALGVKTARVRSHLKHLEKDKGVKFAITGEGKDLSYKAEVDTV